MEIFYKLSFSERLYLIIILVANIFSVYFLICEEKYDATDVIFIAFIMFLGYLYTLQLYKYIRRDTYEKRSYFFVLNYKQLNWFMFIYMLAMIVYGLRTGDGAAEKAKLFSSSIFASMWVPDAIFPFYYCLNREKHKYFTRLVSFLYIFYKVSLGWTSVLLLVVILELYYIYKYKYMSIFKNALIIILIFFIASVSYAFLHTLKYSIRYEMPFSFSKVLTPYQGFCALSKRLAHLDTTLFVNSHINDVIYIYKNQNVFLAEFKSSFRPLVPSKIMHDKIFSNIGSCIYNAKSGYNGINITDNVGILYYYNLLFKCDPFSFILYIFQFVAFIFLLKKMYSAFQNRPGQFNILYFWIFVHGYSICGTMENWITNSYIKLIFFLPLLWGLKIIKVHRIR